MKKALAAIIATVANLDQRFETACENMERKVCGGKTVDEQIDKVDAKIVNASRVTVSKISDTAKPVSNKVLPAYTKSVEAVKSLGGKMKFSMPKIKKAVKSQVLIPVTITVREEPKVEAVKSAPINTPFIPCTSGPAVTKSQLVRVEAIAITEACSHCGEYIPTEAAYCPMCAAQLIIPQVVCVAPALPLKPIPPVHVVSPGKRTIASRIKAALITDITKFGLPYVKCTNK